MRELSLARFTTVDPIRDGTNWHVYCNGDAVNFVDLWGLEAGDRDLKNSNSFYQILDELSDMTYSTFNLDFGRDFTQYAYQAFSNGNYVQSLAYEVDAAAEIAFDLFFAGIGASYVGGAVSGIETAISTGSITAGCINAQIEINKNIESLKNMTYNAFNTAKTGFSNFLLH